MMTECDLFSRARALRRRLDGRFAPDTASPGTKEGGPPSAGHCAAVAILVNTFLGGTYVSAMVDGVSHWFNRFEVQEVDSVRWVDIDLTGDQFGRDRVTNAPAGTLYEGTRERASASLNEETVARARLLASRVVRP